MGISVESLDIVMKNGRVVDGCGNPWFYADIGVKDGKIVAIGDLEACDASVVVEACEKIVSPGFIDMHTHSDAVLLANPTADSHLCQGITTDVVGNCGISMTPVSEVAKRQFDSILGAFNLKWEWSSLKEYLDTLEARGVGVNVLPLIGQGTLRAAVMGMEHRPPNEQELRDMKSHVARQMEAGAFGISTGLFYAPSGYATTQELIELAKVVAEYRGIYASHMRSEGDNLMEAIKETLEIGKKARIPVHISHFKACGRTNWGKVKEGFRLIEDARQKGVDVTCDAYPWMAGVTPLSDYPPHWAVEGGVDKLLERLRNPETRTRIRRDMEQGVPGEESLVKEVGWDRVIVSQSPSHVEWEGKTIHELAKSSGEDPYDLAFDLLIEEHGQVMMIEFWGTEDDVISVLKHPLTMISSDSWAIAPTGPLGSGKPHPRFYGNVPRLLGEYVREKGIIPLEEAVRKMTSFPAQRLALRDRGQIREGMWADIVVFDSGRVRERGTFADPHHFPDGIEWVLVNGVIAIQEGKATGALAGKALRKTTHFP